MICHPDIGHCGRLGNALFQYAAVKGIAALTNCEGVLPEDINQRVWDGQVCQLQNFKIQAKYVGGDELNRIQTHFQESSPRVFDERVAKLPPNTCIYGHYESYKYFEHIEDKIKREFCLVDSIREQGRLALNSFKVSDDTQIIGIHIRLGDYAHIYRPVYSDPSHWIHAYLKTAIQRFNGIRNKRFVCFTGGNKQDGQDASDIAFVKDLVGKYIPANKVFFSEGNPSIVDFSMLTQVNHLVVLTFSTFIWWAGFLNTTNNATIIVPKNAQFSKDTDYWHPRFIQL